MRRLAWGVLAALALGASSAMGWQGEYWPDWVPVEKKGTVSYWDRDARKYVDIPVEVDSDGNVVWEDPGGLDAQTLAAIEALTVALKAEASVEELQHRVDATAKKFNDKLTELKGEVDKNANTLAAHLNSVGDEDSLTNLLADVAWSGKYEELIHIPTLHCEESEEYPGWKCLWLYYLAGTAGDSEAVSYGDPIWMPNLAFSGKDTDIIYESAPYSSMVQKSGDKYYNYVVSVNAQTHQLEYTQGAEVVFSCKCNNGEGCQCGGSGGSGGNCTCESSGKTCNCSIKTADDVHAAEIDPTFTDWRDGTFAPWKEWVDDGINNTARHVGAIETYLGYSPMSPKLPGNPPGL